MKTFKTFKTAKINSKLKMIKIKNQIKIKLIQIGCGTAPGNLVKLTTLINAE